MDLNKQKLKNRLNVKFEPLKSHKNSLKKMEPFKEKQRRDLLDYSKNQQTSKNQEILRNRSISHRKLPSLQQKAEMSKIIAQPDAMVNLKDLKQRIKSIKQLPTIKVQSKSSIHSTLTYLIQHQILNIPKIVALLQKSHSEEFIYMRVRGIYQYEVCDEQNKGNSYITVSRNGMVTDGELVSLEDLIHEFEIYSKLKKIHFYQYYAQIKFMNKWNRGSKKAHFIEHKFKIKRLLSLDYPQLLQWKILLHQILALQDKGGSLLSGWVDNIASEVKTKKQKVEEQLVIISYQMLQKFQLPISQSYELMNKVMGNLINLNLNFEKKIRIQKELQMIYKMGRTLQFHSIQNIGQFLIRHLQTIINKFVMRNQIYISSILQPLEQLSPTKDNYVSQKQKILRNSVILEQVNFTLTLEQFNLKISPSIKQIELNIKEDIKTFISTIERYDFKIIRTPKFNFVVQNVIKAHDTDHSSLQKQFTLKDYIYSIPAYFQTLKELHQQVIHIDNTFQRRIKLLQPFIQIYKKYKQKSLSKEYKLFNYDNLSSELTEIEQHLTFCKQKIHEGQYFLFGYLSQLDAKETIIDFLTQYKEQVIAVIPSMIKHKKEQLVQKLEKHLVILRNVIKTPDDFIKIHQQCELLQQLVLDFVSELRQVEKLQELYLFIKKVQTTSLVEERGLLNELKIKMKNFKQVKQTSFLFYRKQLQSLKSELVDKVTRINNRDEQFYKNADNIKIVYNRVHRNMCQLQEINKELKHLNQLESFFNLKTTFINRLEVLTNQFESLDEIWSIYNQHHEQSHQFLEMTVMKITSKQQVKKYQTFHRKLQKHIKNIEYYELCKYLIDQIQIFLDCLYLIDDFQNKILRKMDYQQIQKIIEKQNKIVCSIANVTFKTILENQLFKHRPQVMQIIFKSHKEQQIEQLLREFDQWWKSVKLQGDYLDEYPLIIIFNDNDNIRKEIEEYSTLLLNIVNHKYGTFARKQCMKHLRNINNLASLLELAVAHQQKFLSLFPILTSKYAEKQLSNQYKRFNSILTKTMKHVKWLIKPTQNLNQNTKALLNNHIKQFQVISKTLTQFLQKKRVKFQRFYFLQDNEMLEVLVGIGKETNIFRMFDGVKGWLVDKEGIKYGVEGIGGQKLPLRGWVYKQQEPQIIFKSLEDAIRSNLNSIVRHMLNSYQNELKQLKHLHIDMPWMCSYTVQLILFTKQIEINCFQNQIRLQTQASLIQETINHYSANPLQNSNHITLQLFLLHFTLQMQQHQVKSVFDFEWNSFLRYYYDKDSVVMKALGSQHQWGGEYQGYWNLMINTSDIRRAHTCVLSNIRYGNGVLLQGPSGTGKTQSLKQLARCMAKYCVIFNCSSQVNIRTLQKLLSGLCYTASWLCLDQINRLTSEIMSVVANQINVIKTAVLQNKQVFNFMGKDMRLKSGVGIFSTMNPIYLKRAKLTQNLKAYFRIISVNVPDYEKILEVLLYSLGVASASQYATKISKMFKNLSIQLSDHRQYDFGLRAMKFFVHNLSQTRKNIKSEYQSIVHALYQTFYSRLDPDDEDTFQKILKDTLGKNIQIQQKNFKIKAMVQAPQTGIIVMGETSSKSTTIKQYCSTFITPYVFIFNPNSLDINHFLGESQLGRWEPGIVEKIARESYDNPERTHILILDAKLKSETIQNFNTLLDESKLLTLSNGTRLKIHNNFKLIMQTPNLQMTSPATITRCNVIFIGESDVDKSQLIKNQLPKLNQEAYHKNYLILSLFTPFQILRIIKLTYLLFPKIIDRTEEFTEGQVIGWEKCLILAIQFEGLADRIKQYIHKDNSLPPKKNIYQFYLSFQRYREGEFVQIVNEPKYIYTLDNIYVPTSRTQFYQIMNKKGIQKSMSILWTGQRKTGKTVSIKNSIDSIIKSSKSIITNIKIPIDKWVDSKQFVDCFQEKLFAYKSDLGESQKLLIYIDNVNLCNEQLSEYIRYLAEHQKAYLPKQKQIIDLPDYLMIADANNSQTNQYNSIFARHLIQINLPEENQGTFKHIFTNFITAILEKTKINAGFKNNAGLESQRIALFFQEYIRKNNEYYASALAEGTHIKQHLTKLSYSHLIPILRNIRFLNDQLCQDTNDLVLFLLSQIRSEEVDMKKSVKQIDFLKLAYHEIYKQKFQKQYDLTLKSYNGSPSESLKYSYQSGRLQKIDNWANFKISLSSRIKQSYFISDFVLQQSIRLLRILDWRKQNYYLVGDPGVGRKSILKIGCHLSDIQVLDNPNIEQKKIADWYFSLLKKTFENKKTICILLDLEISSNLRALEFLERVTAGFPIVGLLNNEDCEYAYSSIEDFDPEYEKYSKQFDKVVKDFIQLARKRLQFLFYSNQTVCGLFKSDYHYLSKQTTFRFIGQFPSQSIIQVSNRLLSNLLMDQQQVKLTSIFLKIYYDLTNLMKSNQINHKNHFKYNPFYHFEVIKHFIKMYKLNQSQIQERQDIFNRSILKVYEISQMLEKFKIQIKNMEPEIQIKTQKILQVVPRLQKKKQASEEVKIVVLEEKREIELKNKQIQNLMKTVQQKIKKAEPLLQDANDSMLTIKRSELSEIRNNSNPHPLIKFTLENLVILLGENQSWENIKKVLSDPNLMSRLKTCSPSLQITQKVKKRIEQNSEWNFDNVSKVSFGSRYIVKFINNIIKFYDLKYSLDKEKEFVESLKKELSSSMADLDSKQKQLELKEQETKLIQRQYNKYKQQLSAIQQLLNQNQRKYQNAQKIKNGLEKQTFAWTEKLQNCKTFKKHLCSISIHIVLFLHVYPSLHSQQQAHIEKLFLDNLEKTNLDYDKKFKVFDYVKNELMKKRQVLNESQISYVNDNFNLNALSLEDSNDKKIIQALYHFNNRPIILDPDNQFLKWVEQQSKGSQRQIKVTITKQSFVSSLKTVETAIKQGHLLILIIEDTLDQFTINVLKSKITLNQHNPSIIEYNKNIFQVHNNFRLFLCNKSRNPNISNKLYITHNILNFQITKNILKNILLNNLLQLENKQIYEIKKKLELERKYNEHLLNNIEAQIIDSLINSKKLLVEDEQFIHLLSQSKAKTEFLKKSEAEQLVKLAVIRKFYNNYDSVCQQASKIFLSLKYLTRINRILAWSTQIFTQYFIQACINSISTPLFEEDDDEQVEFHKLQASNFEFNQYNMSLSNSRPTSALSYISGVTVNIDERKEDFEEQHPTSIVAFENLIGKRQMAIDQKMKGNMTAQRESKIIQCLIEFFKPAFTQHESTIWGLILCLMNYEFKDIKILVDVQAKRKKLKQYIEAGELSDRIKNFLIKHDDMQNQVKHYFTLSNPLHKLSDQLSEIQILLLCKLVHPPAFLNLCKLLISNKGYKTVIDYAESSTSDWFRRSDNMHPILLIMGEDPMQMISEYLAKKKYKNVILLAMGQGQSKIAEIIIQKESKKQNLVIIHNLHISPQFFTYLAKVLQQFQIRPPHKNFRLILISQKVQMLNEQITTYCHKYLIEQPIGLQNQMKYLQEQIPLQCQFTQPLHRNLGYSLSFMHSIVNNLLNYKPFGWNLHYQFHTSDYLNSIKFLKQIIETRFDLSKYECNIDIEADNIRQQTETIDFKALQYLIGEIGYVGKLADELDRTKMRIFIQQFISQKPFKAENALQSLKTITFPKNYNFQSVISSIQTIPENDSTIFGLNSEVKPIYESPEFIIQKFIEALNQRNIKVKTGNIFYNKFIEPIYHKFDFVNKQIKKHNENIIKIKNNQISNYTGNGYLLSNLTPISKVFNLKAFSNPRQFFIDICKDFASKQNVSYDKVELSWSIHPRQNVQSIYGISHLMLEGASLNHGALDDGMIEKDLMLYVWASLKKKEKELINKKLVGIPLYLEEERQGQINSYGDNTNLLAKVKLQSCFTQEFWTLRSTAFICM